MDERHDCGQGEDEQKYAFVFSACFFKPRRDDGDKKIERYKWIHKP